MGGRVPHAEYTPSPELVASLTAAADARNGRRKGADVVFTCPSGEHEDRTPSARLNVSKATWYCDVCGNGGGALDLAQRLGVELSPLGGVLANGRQPRPDGRPPRRLLGTVRHELRDEAGFLVAVHVRKDYDDGSKDLPWERPDGSNGLGGLPIDTLPLYGVHELGDAAAVVLVEGEKARDALARLGVPAVGTVTGAKSCPNDDALRPLVGRDVILWPDADADGDVHMNRAAARLAAIGQAPEKIRLLDWPDAPPSGDAADFAAAGGTAEAARALIAAAPPFVSAAPKGGVPAESNVPFRSAPEVAAAVSAEPRFVADPYVAEGAITEVDGKIKAAGKTTWTTHLCRRVLDGSPFMGRPTRRSPVVYLTEQSPATFRETLRRADLLDREDFRILFWHEVAALDWPDVVRAARAEARRIGARLLVVDTLPQFAGIRGDAENNAGAALEAVAPLQEGAAADGLAVMILRHERKGGGDVGDSGRGSSAFAGAVDVVIQLRRAEGQGRPAVRVLNALSRFDQTPDTLVIELTESGYVALGDAEAVAAHEARTAVLDAAPASEADAIKEADLLAGADVKRTVGQDAVREHVAAGRLARVGEGKRGDPYRYWRPAEAEKLSAAPPVVAAESKSPASGARPLLSAATPTLGAAESNGLPDEWPDDDPLTETLNDDDSAWAMGGGRALLGSVGIAGFDRWTAD